MHRRERKKKTGKWTNLGPLLGTKTRNKISGAEFNAPEKDRLRACKKMLKLKKRESHSLDETTEELTESACRIASERATGSRRRKTKGKTREGFLLRQSLAFISSSRRDVSGGLCTRKDEI